MITLDFDARRWDSRDDAEASPVSSDPAAIEETYFLVPFRFEIDGVELLEGGGHGRLLPLVGFACLLRQALEAARSGGPARLFLAGGGELRLSVHDDRVKLTSSTTRNTAAAQLDDMLAASRALSVRARDVLLERFPEMRAHRDWSRWFEA